MPTQPHTLAQSIRLSGELVEAKCSCGFTMLGSATNVAQAFARHQSDEIARMPLRDLMDALRGAEGKKEE